MLDYILSLYLTSVIFKFLKFWTYTLVLLYRLCLELFHTIVLPGPFSRHGLLFSLCIEIIAG